MENLFNNADGVAEGMVVIATNAGYRGTKQEVMRNNALACQTADGITKLRWKVLVWDKPAPWHTKAVLADAKSRNTPSEFARLWYGKWVSGKGDALAEDDIDRCLACHVGPINEPEDGWQYLAGMDLGVSHDHAAIVVVGVNQLAQRMRIAWMRGFEPKEKPDDPSRREVNLIEVKNTLVDAFEVFKLQYVGYDPTEARLMAQQLKRLRVPMQEMLFSSPKNQQDMAAALVQAVSGKILIIEERENDPRKNDKRTKKMKEPQPVNLDCTLEGYEDSEGRLRRDFGKLKVVRKAYGYKLEATSDEYGHADVGVALAIVLPRAIQMLSGHVGLQRDDVLDVDDSPLTDEEVANMPDDLREIYDEYDPYNYRKD
jgi:hypothetical protein